jgi:hypothetical protein
MRATLRAADAHLQLPQEAGRLFSSLHGDSTIVLLPKYWGEINVARESELRCLEGADVE